MELSKQDTKMTKGLAIIFMVTLHLFNRVNDLPYECLKIGDVPLIYYISLIADCCVAIYCFCSGYALQIICEKIPNSKSYYKNRVKSTFKFLINFWIVLIIFSLIGIIFDKSGNIPGSITKFIGNFLLFDLSYNGAWWFITTYIFLIIISRPLYIAISKLNPIFINVVCLVIYIAAYFQRIHEPVKFNSDVLNWTTRQLALLGTSVLPFAWGMYFYKFKLFTKIRLFVDNYLKQWQYTILNALIFLLLIIAHSIVPSMIVAPFTGLVIIIIFNAGKKGKFINTIFSFAGEHSTNIWLTHMFFYSVLFTGFIFVFKYPILIFAAMIIITLSCSFIINLLYKPIVKLIK